MRSRDSIGGGENIRIAGRRLIHGADQAPGFWAAGSFLKLSYLAEIWLILWDETQIPLSSRRPAVRDAISRSGQLRKPPLRKVTPDERWERAMAGPFLFSMRRGRFMGAWRRPSTSALLSLLASCDRALRHSGWDT